MHIIYDTNTAYLYASIQTYKYTQNLIQIQTQSVL